jgi:hypothetical protein
MAVSAIGGAILVNQMTPAASSVQGGQYTRFELQNVAAQAAVQEKQKEVEELRPTEENHAVDPDREHNRQEADEEMSEQAKKPSQKSDEQNTHTSSTTHLLDIKV